jgi:hypothetical protein
VFHAIDQLSAIERPAAALVCLHRFARTFGIHHPALAEFIEHLWGVVHVTPETWVSWAAAFDEMVILQSEDTYPADLTNAIPAALRGDFSALVRAVFATSEATWYCSNPAGTRDALVAVIEILSKHGISLPDLSVFSGQAENSGDSWGPKPSESIVAHWKRM